MQQYGGVPPYYETRTYVARIVRDYNRKKIAERKAAAATAKAARAKPATPAAVQVSSKLPFPMLRPRLRAKCLPIDEGVILRDFSPEGSCAQRIRPLTAI